MNNADKLAKYHPAIVAIQYFIGLPLLNNRRSDKLLMLTPMKKHQPIGSINIAKNATITIGSNKIFSIILKHS